MKRMLKNKKGDIAITLLVMGVFAVCSLALLTFFISDFTISNSFVGIDMVHKLNSQIDEYDFYASRGISDESLKIIFGNDLIEESGKKYFYHEKTFKRFKLWKLKYEEIILFSVKYEIPS